MNALTLRVVVLAVMLTPGSLAHAHGSIPSVYEVAEIDGTVAGLGTTFGLILGDDGGYRWTCSDAVGQPVTGYIIRSQTDVVVSTVRGLYRTRDAGCTYEFYDSALGELNVSEVRERGGTTYAITSDIEAPNTVYRSDDRGLTWAALPGELQGVALYGLSVEDDRVLVTGLSADDGWVVYEWTADGPELVAPLIEGLLNVEIWLAGSRTWLVDVIANTSRLYELEGDSLLVRSQLMPVVLTDVLWDGDRLLVSADDNRIYELSGTELNPIDGFDGACFLDLPRSGPIRCGAPSGNAGYYVGPLAADEVSLQLSDVRANECVLEPGHVCGAVWPFAATLLGAPEDNEAGGRAAAGDGGCSVSGREGAGQIGAWASLLALALARRRS